MRRFFILLCLLSVASIAAAQGSDDRSRLIRFLEDALSDDSARQVRIEGFRGALSSTASLDRLTIADADGVWLIIEGAELTWSRAALLSGAVDITRLAAERIILERVPASSSDPATPEATPFALPELPVSIAIDALEVGRIELGADLLGFAVVAQADGSLSLAGGQGAALLNLTRIDGPQGAFILDSSYSNESGILDVSLELAEDPGGIAVSLLGIPDNPSVNLTIAGTGPLSDFTARTNLATDGQQRLSGDVVLGTSDTGEQRVNVDLSGDVARLLLPEYQPFFGDEVSLIADMRRVDTGAAILDRFDLRTASLTITGNAMLDAGGVPERFSLIAALGADGAAVRLPVPGQVVEVISADLTLSYDRDLGNAWDGQARLVGLDVDDVQLELAQLDLTGTIDTASNVLTGITADITSAFRGLAQSDPALQAAIGATGRLDFSVNWQDDGPVHFTDLELSTQNAEMRGTAQISTGENALVLVADLQGMFPDLSAFADLADLPLEGAVNFDLNAETDLLSGAFDANFLVVGHDMEFGAGEPEGMFAGETTITVYAIRNASGLRIETFDLFGAELTAQGRATLSSTTSEMDVTAQLRDASLVTAALSGPVTADLNLSRAAADRPWDVQASGRAQGGLTADIAGQIGLPDGAVDLTVEGAAPLALVNQFILPRSVQGTAQFDLTVNGAPGLNAITGVVSANGMRIAAPNAGIAVENTSVTVQLNGGRTTVTGQGTFSSGGSVSLDGALDLAGAGLPGQFDIVLSNVIFTQDDLFQTIVERGVITLAGALTNGPSLRGEIVLGQTDINIVPTSFGAAEPIPDIRHVGESYGQRLTRNYAGLLQRGSGPGGAPLALDLTVITANRVFLRGSGLDAEMGGSIRIGGTTDNVIPSGQFDLIRGRLSLAGQRFDLIEGSVTLSGDFDPFMRVVAQSQAGDTLVLITLQGSARAPELLLRSQPDLPEDEILSRLLFGRGVSSLSPIQALQLIDGVSRLAGSGSIIGGLRRSLGVDDLDLTTDEAGNAEVRFGRYIGENAYTDIGIGSDGEAEVSLNLDLTPNLTARGTFSSDGQSGLGVFFERDY